MAKKSTKRDLVDELNDLVADGTSKKYIEQECKLPANSLASVLTRKKSMPAKWIPRLMAFVARPIIPTEQKQVKTELVFKAPGSRKIEIYELKASDIDFKAPTQESYDSTKKDRYLIDELGQFPEIDKTAASIKAETALNKRLAELEKKNDALKHELDETCLQTSLIIDKLKADVRLMGDNNVKLEHRVAALTTENLELRQKAAKGPSLADVVMGVINKPAEDRAANLRDIKSGKGKKEGK